MLSTREKTKNFSVTVAVGAICSDLTYIQFRNSKREQKSYLKK